MLRFAVITAVGALAAAGAARALIDYAPAPPPVRQAPLRGPQSSDPAAEPAPQAASVTKAADGHFWAEGAVNGERIRFLVDTGASAVALTPVDAQRLGFDLSSLTYDVAVHTANGDSRAARVKLASVSVAGARVADVDALVVHGGLEVSLLGMSYLGRLSRFEASQNALILRP